MKRGEDGSVLTAVGTIAVYPLIYADAYAHW